MDKPVFIIGGGPSLIDFNFDRLKNYDTIAINKAIFHAPWAKYFITHDLAFFHKLTPDQFNKFKTTKTTKILVMSPVTFPYMEIAKNKFYDRRPFHDKPAGFSYDLRILDMIIISKQEQGIGLTWDEFRHGHNSGYSALQFAVIQGYNPIYLLGFDMRVDPDNAHWHEGYGEDPQAVQSRLDYYLHNFNIGLLELKDRAPWVKIYNCNGSSRLKEPFVINLDLRSCYGK